MNLNFFVTETNSLLQHLFINWPFWFLVLLSILALGIYLTFLWTLWCAWGYLFNFLQNFQVFCSKSFFQSSSFPFSYKHKSLSTVFNTKKFQRPPPHTHTHSRIVITTTVSFVNITASENESWLLSHVRLFVIPWTIACPWNSLSTEFSRQEYWSGLPIPSPGDPPNPEVEPAPPALQADSLPFEPQEKPS